MTSKDKSSRGGKPAAGRDSANRNRSGKPGGKPPVKRFDGAKASGRPFDGEKAERPAKPRPAAARGDRDGASARFGGEKREGRSFDKPKSFRGEGKPRGDMRPRVKPEPVETGADGQKPERISKLLARAGVASRRDVERMILEGRVALNGTVLDTPVVLATLADRIEVDGMPIRGIERTRLWLYHKPAGLVTTNSDPEGRPTVFENLPEDLPRVLSIGRLDINTEGLLLLTNDGGLSRVLELPSTGWLRRYRVRAHGEIDQAKLDTLKEGIAVDGVLYGGIDAVLDRQQGHNVWITMGLREGKNREIKNVLGALGLEVNRLIRLSYGPFQLGDLPEGAVVEVRGRLLRDQLGPRLIEEARANFEAPIYNQPVRENDEEEAAAAPKRGPARDRTPRDDRGEDEGRKPRGGATGGKTFRDKPFDRGDRDSKQFDAAPKRKPSGTSRTTNVWMAPGAKPLTEKHRARRGAVPNAKPVVASPDIKGPRVTVTRAAEDRDWIRAENPAKKEEGGFGKKRFGDRPDRGDRPPRGDRPDRGDRPPRGERPERGSFGDRPPRGDRADRGDRPPRGERPERGSFGDRPDRSERPAGRKPSGGKPFGGKPGGKPFGGRPGGGRPSGGKPSGGGPRGRKG